MRLMTNKDYVNQGADITDDDMVVVIKKQDLIDIRCLISIAAWIRSEQLAQAGKIICMGDGPDRLEVDTRDLNRASCHKELEACQTWWQKITEILNGAAFDARTSWQK